MTRLTNATMFHVKRTPGTARRHRCPPWAVTTITRAAVLMFLVHAIIQHFYIHH